MLEARYFPWLPAVISVFQPENSAGVPKWPYNPLLAARFFKKGPIFCYVFNMQKRLSGLQTTHGKSGKHVG